MQNKSHKSAAARSLIEWFQSNARILPWRGEYDPYKVLVSEFMLQQTQVDTVYPYFERWIARYPDLSALAQAEEADVRKLWEGLGYYSRALNLLKAAQAMTHAGLIRPPSTVEELLKYPGIGPYTAGAISSIAYENPVAAVDGNVERVMSRFCDIAEPSGSAPLKRAATEAVLGMMPPGEARDFNQALMELGALICLPRNPVCEECPWETFCRSRASGTQPQRPLPKQKPAVENINAWGILCRIGSRCLLRKRPDKGLWSGLWEIPWITRDSDDYVVDIGVWGQALNLEIARYEEIGSVGFAFTRYRVKAWVVECRIQQHSPLLDRKIKEGEWGLFDKSELSDLPLPAPSRKFLKLAGEDGKMTLELRSKPRQRAIGPLDSRL